MKIKIRIPYLIRKRAAFLRFSLKTKPAVRDLLLDICVLFHDSNLFLFKLMRSYRRALEVRRGYCAISDIPALYIETINQCNAKCFMSDT